MLKSQLRKIKGKNMWKEYPLSLNGLDMSFYSKLIVWLLFFQWIDFLILVAVDVESEILITKVFYILGLFGIVYMAARTTMHRVPVEAFSYVRNLMTNRPNVLYYYIPDGLDEEDINNRIYRL